MADDAAAVAVVFGVGGVRIIKRRLKNTGGKIDVIHGGTVIGIDRGRAHAPLAAIDGGSDLGKLAAIFKLSGALRVSEGVPANDSEFGVIAPMVGIADLIGHRAQLFLGSNLGGRAHPGEGFDFPAHGRLNVAHHLDCRLLAGGWKFLSGINLAKRLAQGSVSSLHATLPASAVLPLSS